MKLHFIGATHDVTGSMTLIETDSGKFLIDAGLYQGVSEITQKNLQPLPFSPAEIDAIFLTHAHLDHSGFIPRLIKLGFRGSIFCNKPTLKLATLIINDSAQILEDNENHLLKNFYSIKDASVVTSLFKEVEFNIAFEYKELKIIFIPAGHILGAASIHISYGDKSVTFSGDLGRHDDPILHSPSPCLPADVVVMESTYGGRTRSGDPHKEFALFLKKLKDESKIGIVASFAVARAQMLILLAQEYFDQHPNDKIRFVIDGPMMTAANKIYREYHNETKCSAELFRALGNVEVINHTREWDSIKKHSGPLLVITSSGMVTGGRIWRYLENWQDDTNALIFLPGFQGLGTPGKSLSEGIKTIHNEEGEILKWSGEILHSQSFSSHADQNELIDWLRNIPKETTIYLNHGEDEAKEKLIERLNKEGFNNCFLAASNSIKI